MQAMSNAVKDMVKSFKGYERRFLVDKLRDPRRRRSDKEGWGEDAPGYSSGGLGEDEHADYLYAPNRYRQCGFKERFIWIRYKSRVLSLMDGIMRIEVRRIGRRNPTFPSRTEDTNMRRLFTAGLQTSRISVQLREFSHLFEDFDDRLDGLDRLEQRLGRIVGVRRVD
jgi:hypothetical protein